MLTTAPPSFSQLQHFDWRATDALLRDQQQSHRLHEPEYRVLTTDPITGNEIENFSSHPSMLDGNLTIYFETDASRHAYQNIPLNHPNRHLPFPATDEDDRGG